MPSNIFGMDFDEATRIAGHLNNASGDTERGIPHVQRTSEGMLAAIQQLVTATQAMEEGMRLLRTVQQDHVNASISTVKTALGSLPTAMQGDPSMALGDTLNTWNSHGNNLWQDIQNVITAGTPIENQLRDWSQPNGQLSRLQQATDTLAASLRKMTESLTITKTGLDRHIAQTQEVVQAGKVEFS